jgi:myosin protein heavy chain
VPKLKKLDLNLNIQNLYLRNIKTLLLGEGMSRAEEVEEARRKLAAKMQEVQEQLDQANQRMASEEKKRHKLQQELEDAQVDAERANSLANSLEKRQKQFDKVVDEWKLKCDALQQELEAAQRDTRNVSFFE